MSGSFLFSDHLKWSETNTTCDNRRGLTASVPWARWMRSVRRPDEYHDLLERAAADRVKRALTGNSELADRNDVLLPDRQSAELGAAARRDNPAAVTQVPLEFIDDTLGFNPEMGGRPHRAAADPVHHHRRRSPGAAAGERSHVCARRRA
jgi:hypothetical protein